MVRVTALVLGLAGAARAQMFGDLPAAPPRERCPYNEFQGRTQVVQDACCQNPEDCAAGLPVGCDMACGAVFVHFFHDCEPLMMQTMGEEQTHTFSDFDKVCKRQDSGEMLMMIYSMSQQGCSIAAIDSADAQQLAADVAMDQQVEGSSHFGLGGAAAHFAQELAVCEWDDVQRKIDNIEHACCNQRDNDDSCENHLPINCDLECAVAFVPFHEDCRSVIAGPLHDQLAGFDVLYHSCQAATRQDTLGLLRAVSDTQENYDDVGSCPVRGALEFFSDCPAREPECIMQFVGANTTLSNLHVYSSYRFNVHSNKGHGGLLCHDEIFFSGPGMCRHELDREQWSAGPVIMGGYTCTEAAVANGGDSVAEDAALCAAVTGADLNTATACEAALTTAADDAEDAKACVYNDPAPRDHYAWYSDGYHPHGLADSPNNIMTTGGSGADYCSYPQTYWDPYDEDWTATVGTGAQGRINECNPDWDNDPPGNPLLCQHWYAASCLHNTIETCATLSLKRMLGTGCAMISAPRLR